MKKFIILFITALLSVLPAKSMTLEEIATLLAARRATVVVVPVKDFVPVAAPYALAEPSAIYSSITLGSIAQIPAVYKVDRGAIGLLKWTAAHDLPNDAVVGYEVRADNGHPFTQIYVLPSTQTTFPFVTSGQMAMINTVTGEFWQVRAVFSSGKRSNWANSQTFPERITSKY